MEGETSEFSALAVGPTAYGADGYGPSMYLRDPDCNVVELKGAPLRRAPA